MYDDGQNSICRFEMDGVSVVFCGCLGAIPSQDVIEKISGAHIMVVPVGEYSTLPMSDVNELISLTKPRIVVPSEFKAGGITLPLSNIQAFSEGRDTEDFAYVGDEVEFDSGDIQDYEGVWIFDF
jgi:L-ascorbate metabolism protein UlaG (beta-lactamase superfamily)